jgi:hypothetical protein
VQDPELEDHPALKLLEPDEELEAHAIAVDARLLVTSRRVAVATDEDRLILDVPIEHLRRVQFDIERSRPATLVLVPESPEDPPQVLAIPPEQYRDVAHALAIIGEHLYTPRASV